MTNLTLAPSRRCRSGTGRHVRVAAVLTIGGAVLAFSACGASAPSSGGSTRSTSPTTSTKPAGDKADCSEQAILSALPGGATMEKFDCAKVGDVEWAAARVAPGSTVFFLQWHGTRWEAEDSASVCGTASAGLPSSLLSYCEASTSARPTPPPRTPTTPVTAACTSKTILAALPQGATMQKFTCADVSGKKWAAARVNPGSTVFFLQWNGSRWNAQDSSSICGTASAGLPQSLLAYCN